MGNNHDSEVALKRIVFYDGYCVLCSKSVDFILSRDDTAAFRFASLQSKFAQNVLTEMGYPTNQIKNVSNIVYLRDDDLKIKSDAVLSILKDLGGIYKITCLAYLIPRLVRDFGYDRLAKVRYTMFGKRDSCRIPTLNDLDRFLG